MDVALAALSAELNVFSVKDEQRMALEAFLYS